MSVSGDLLVVDDQPADAPSDRRVTSYVHDRAGTSDVGDDHWALLGSVATFERCCAEPSFGAIDLRDSRVLVTFGNDDAHVFRLEDGGTALDLTDDVWIAEDRIRLPDGPVPASGFGVSGAIDGDRAVIGAPYEASSGEEGEQDLGSFGELELPLIDPVLAGVELWFAVAFGAFPGDVTGVTTPVRVEVGGTP